MSSKIPSESEQILDTEEGLPLRMSIRVHRRDLRATPNNGLFKSNVFSRLLNHVPLVDRKRILVTNAAHGTEDTVLYCPETLECESTHATPTQFVKVDPYATSDLVHRDDQFEISFVGMSATPQDVGKTNNNELLLYSLLRQKYCDNLLAETKEQTTSTPPAPSASASLEQHVPTGIAKTNDVPFIHYDPVIDGHDEGTKPDSYVPIPASKRLYYRHNKDQNGDKNAEQTVNIRFTLMEIDKISDILARAPSSVDQLGSYVSDTAGAVPYMEIVAKALTFASELGKEGIKHYEKPDHVLSTDVEFLLAEPEDGLPQKDGDYLRYGHYFFLSKPVDAQVYAQNCSSAQHMPLMMKRENLTLKKAKQNEKLYFPLTGVSYLVMKVSRGYKNTGFRHNFQIHDEHRKRLENMLQMRGIIEMLSGVKDKSKLSRKNTRK